MARNFLFFLLYSSSLCVDRKRFTDAADGRGGGEENPNKSKIYPVFNKTKTAGLSVKDINFIKNRVLKEKNLNADRDWMQHTKSNIIKI